MKKAILLSFILAMSFLSTAQDIVQYGDSCYMFQYLPNGYGSNWGGAKDIFTTIYCEHIQRFNVERNQERLIYGIAETLDLNPEMPDSVLWPALWQVQNGQLVCVDSSTVIGGRREFQYDFLITGVNGVPVVPPELMSKVVPCYEYYFDQPIVVTDSFYIGHMYRPNWLNYYTTSTGYRGHLTTFNEIAADYWFTKELVPAPHVGFWGLFFPILHPYCPKMDAPGVRIDGYEANVAWESGSDQYELSVVRRGLPLDSGFVVPIGDTSYVAMGLDSGVYYQARVRHTCVIGGTTWWSDWSAPTAFYLGNTDPDSLGIAAVDLQPEVTLTPNPAADRVTVAAEGMERVELIGVDGTVLLRRDCHGECQIDLTGLAAGLYLVRATTPRGTATRSLVVAR